MSSVFVQYAALGAAICFVFYRKAVFNFFTQLLQPVSAQAPVASEPKLSKKRAKAALKTVHREDKKSTTAAQTSSAGNEKATDDAAFAREFALTQKGTDLTRRTDKKGEQRAKTRKQGQAEESQSSFQHSTDLAAEAGAAPSINGLPNSLQGPAPALAATSTAYATGMDTDYGRRTADTLRIATEEIIARVPREAEWTSVPTKSQKTQKKAERAEETKKQRQRQAQKEQYREIKEEADNKQRMLMEKQRREARIARGEPARNGEAYREASAPSKSVWSKQAQSAESVEAQTALLDTMDAIPATVAGPIIANGEENLNSLDD